MRAVLTIVGKDLRLRLRDRSVLLFGVVAPLVLAAALGAVFGDVEDGFSVRLAVAGSPAGPAGTALVDDVLPALVDDGLFEDVRRLDGRGAVVAAVEAGDADAGVVLGADDAIEVVGSADAPTSRSVAESVVTSVLDEGRAAELAVAGALASGELAPPDVPDVVAAVRATTGTRLVDEPVGVQPLDTSTGVAAGISVFFLFFAVGIAVTGLLEEDRDGTLARLRTAPVGTWVPIAAKGLTALVVGIGSMVTLVVATTVLLGADWGAPLPLLLLIAAAVAAAVGVVALVASLARTPESAGSAQGVVGTVLGALGGSFFPIAAGGLLGIVSDLTPHAWFLRGIREVAGGAPLGDVAPSLLVLLAMALVTSALAAVRFRSTLGA